MTGRNQVNANDPTASEKADELIAEAEWYEWAFDSKLRGVAHEYDGRPHLVDNVLEEGADNAAMAILAIAMTEELSLWSLSTLRDIYDGLNSAPARGGFRIKVQLRGKGRSKQSFKQMQRLQEADKSFETIIKHFVDKGFKKEAVVAGLLQRNKTSRAGAFRRLARAKKNRRSQ